MNKLFRTISILMAFIKGFIDELRGVICISGKFTHTPKEYKTVRWNATIKDKEE